MVQLLIGIKYGAAEDLSSDYTQTLRPQIAIDELNLPSAEYRAAFSDGSVTLLSAHSDEMPEGSLEEMLQAAGIAKTEVSSVYWLPPEKTSEALVKERVDFIPVRAAQLSLGAVRKHGDVLSV